MSVPQVSTCAASQVVQTHSLTLAPYRAHFCQCPPCCILPQWLLLCSPHASAAPINTHPTHPTQLNPTGGAGGAEARALRPPLVLPLLRGGHPLSTTQVGLECPFSARLDACRLQLAVWQLAAVFVESLRDPRWLCNRPTTQPNTGRATAASWRATAPATRAPTGSRSRPAVPRVALLLPPAPLARWLCRALAGGSTRACCACHARTRTCRRCW
jgi:hypothetical protein